jgi:hypothetical protein
VASCRRHGKFILETRKIISGITELLSRVSGEDLRGLRQLKERLGPRLEKAIILHTGEHAYTR